MPEDSEGDRGWTVSEPEEVEQWAWVGDVILSGFDEDAPGIFPVVASVVGVDRYARCPSGRALAGSKTPFADALAALAAHLIDEDDGAAAPEGSAVAALIEEHR